jgi:hypothetical protein
MSAHLFLSQFGNRKTLYKHMYRYNHAYVKYMCTYIHDGADRNKDLIAFVEGFLLLAFK